MAEEPDTDRYYFQREKLEVEEEDDFPYDQVTVDEDFLPPELDEDLETAVRTIKEQAGDSLASVRKESGVQPSVTEKPEVVDDFVRNFLFRMGMSRTLDCFQTEWYELQQDGLINDGNIGIVPDVYIRNQQLEKEMHFLRTEVIKFREAALKAKDTYVKLRKERDYHRMHHKRVVQEKNKLITDIRRLKSHYESYEPTLKQLKQKYEVAMKEKMMSKLERDRVLGQVAGLKSTLQNMDGTTATNGQAGLRPGARGSLLVDEQGRGPTQRSLAQERAKWEGTDIAFAVGERHPDDSVFPQDIGVNPLLSQVKGPSSHLTRTGGFRLSNTIQAHSHAVSSVAMHPRKQVVVSTSDDNTWKMWAVPAGDIIMTGEGHTDWVGDCDFNPEGNSLATVSGDTTVKIWDFAKAECVHTFTDHSHAVWSCSWHSCGDFLATSSMDNTSRIWDLGSLRCRYILRGHADSVNSIQFLHFSNTILTASADKTLSLWDARTGMCAHTFYGHTHSVNHATFNLKGDVVASCDSFGVVRLWDVRKVSPLVALDCGPHPANKLSFDASGSVLAIASHDSAVKMYDVAGSKMSNMEGHEDSVQCVVFDRSGDFVVSGGSDHTLRVWS